MDENDFLNAFMGLDILKVEGIGKVIGRVVSKLREGMIEGGMEPFEADRLITEALRVFMQTMFTLYTPPGAQP